MSAYDSQLPTTIESLEVDDKPKPAVPRLSSESQLPPFLRLPLEIHLQITSYFEAAGDPAILQLARISRYFHHIIAAPDHQLVLKIEKHLDIRALKYLACRYCLRLRKHCQFTDKILRKTGLNGPHCNLRYCVDCGFTYSRGPAGPHYGPGTYVIAHGQAWGRCRICLSKKEAQVHLEACGICLDCHSLGHCHYSKLGRDCVLESLQVLIATNYASLAVCSS